MKALRLVAAAALLVGTPFSYNGIIDSQFGLTVRAFPGELNLGSLWLSNFVFWIAHSLLAGVVAFFAASVAHFVLQWSSFYGALALTIAVFVSNYGVFIWQFLAVGDSYFRLADMSALAFFMLIAWLALRIFNRQQSKAAL